jgi:hypothetical protein
MEFSFLGSSTGGSVRSGKQDCISKFYLATLRSGICQNRYGVVMGFECVTSLSVVCVLLWVKLIRHTALICLQKIGGRRGLEEHGELSPDGEGIRRFQLHGLPGGFGRLRKDVPLADQGRELQEFVGGSQDAPPEDGGRGGTLLRNSIMF